MRCGDVDVRWDAVTVPEELDDEYGAPPERYEVFNPDHSVGIACDRDGEIAGLHIGAEVADCTEEWLAAEILMLARLAHHKSGLARRARMAAAGIPPYIIDQFGFPTAVDYTAMERAAFGE